MDEEHLYKVSIETWGEGVGSVDDGALSALVPVLRDVGAVGPVASAGGVAGGPGATFSVRIWAAGSESDAFAKVASTAIEIFDAACEKTGITHKGVARLDILKDALCEPRPVQSPSIPLWVGGMGERRTLRVVAEVADGWNTFLMPEEEYRHKLDVLAEHCKDFGRDPGDIRKQLGVSVTLGGPRRRPMTECGSARRPRA